MKRGRASSSALPERMGKLLRRAASRGETVTYGELMRRFGLSRGRALSHAISLADRLEYGAGAPGFAAIIVRKDTGYPGGGYFCDDELPPSLQRDASRSADARLSKGEREHLDERQKEIWAYYKSKVR